MAIQTKDPVKAKSTTGISLSTSVNVESRLSFKPRIEDANLCKAFMITASVEMIEVGKTLENGQENTSEYAGTTVPNLILEFQQTGTSVDPKPRFFKHRWNLPVLKKADGTPLDRKVVMDIATGNITQIIHILQAYKGAPNYVLPDMEINVDPFAPVGERIEQYTEFYNQVVSILVGEDPATPCFKGVGVWIKLVVEYGKARFLTLPKFVGQGFIERIQSGVKSSLSFKPDESIVLKATVKAGANGAPNGEHVEPVSADLADVLEKYSL